MNDKYHSSEPSFDDLLRLFANPELRIGDYPAIQSLLEELIQSEGKDPYLLELAASNIPQLSAIAQASGDPFWANAPARNSIPYDDESIFLGMLSTGDPMVLPAGRTLYNTGIFGRTGSSKTTLAQLIAIQLVLHGFCVVVIDQKRGWRKLLKLPQLQNRVRVLNLTDFRCSLIQPAPGQSNDDAANQATRLIGQSFALISAQRLFRDVCTLAMKNRPPHDYPRLSELIERVRTFQAVRGYRESEYKASIYWTLVDLQNHLGPVFDYSESDFMERLLAGNQLNILEAPALPANHLAFSSVYIPIWCFRRNMYNPEARQRPTVMILEDATALVDAAWDRMTPGGTTPLSEMMNLSRELRIGTILIAHSLSSISPKSLQSLESYFLCSLQNEDPRRIQQLIGATLEQAQTIRNLSAGSTVGLVPSIHPQPVLIKYPPIPELKVTDDDCRRSAQAFLAEVHSVKNEWPSANPYSKPNTPSQASSTRSAVSPDMLSILVELTNPIPLPLSRLYEKIHLDRKIGVRIQQQLENDGLVHIHTILTGKRGSALRLLELTAAGWKIMKEKGFCPPTSPAKGGWLHSLAVNVIQELGRRQKYTVNTEVKVSDLFFDARWRTSTGELTFWQVGISSPDREAENILKALKIPAILQGKLNLVVPDRKFADHVTRLLKEQSPGIANNSSFHILLIGELLTEYYG